MTYYFLETGLVWIGRRRLPSVGRSVAYLAAVRASWAGRQAKPSRAPICRSVRPLPRFFALILFRKISDLRARADAGDFGFFFFFLEFFFLIFCLERGEKAFVVSSSVSHLTLLLPWSAAQHSPVHSPDFLSLSPCRAEIQTYRGFTRNKPPPAPPIHVQLKKLTDRPCLESEPDKRAPRLGVLLYLR